MSIKSLESVVRELQNTIVTLVCKVETLEGRVNELHGIIAKTSQSADTNNTRKSFITGHSTTVSAQAAPIKRAARNARVNASLSIAEMSSIGKRRSNGRETTKVSSQSGVRTPNVVSVTSNAEQSQTKNSEATVHILPTTSQRDSTSLDETDNNSDRQWNVVAEHRPKKRLRPVTVGTGKAIVVGANKDDHGIQAADRIKYIQAWQFRPDTTKEQVELFLKQIVDADYVVHKRNIKTDKHASFVIGMPERAYSKVTMPAAWPQGVRFATWFFRASTNSQPAIK